MEKKFGNDFIEIFDEEGNKHVLEHLDTIEIDDTFYLLFLPADIKAGSPGYGHIILQADGDDFILIEDEAYEQEIYGLFLERLYADESDKNHSCDSGF